MDGGELIPVKASEYPVPIGLRVSRAQAEKIDSWAAQMGLQRNSMLRYLIEHARLVDVPSICMDSSARGSDKEVFGGSFNTTEANHEKVAG
jgi:hypothetical protein